MEVLGEMGAKQIKAPSKWSYVVSSLEVSFIKMMDLKMKGKFTCEKRKVRVNSKLHCTTVATLTRKSDGCVDCARRQVLDLRRAVR